MTAPLLSRRDIEFYLYEVFQAEDLTSRARYSDHNRESFDAALDLAEKIAVDHFLPIRKKVDRNPPEFDGERVRLIPDIKAAYEAVAEAGLIAADQDYSMGGMQLPPVVSASATAYLTAAGSTTNGYHALTAANASLLEAHGDEEQIATWVPRLRSGEFAGTMALSEPHAGSSLSDITTKAVLQSDGSYRLYGSKIWISGGDQELSSNIVHAVLARIEGAPPGVPGISLFICPKFLLDESGQVSRRNDVHLTGLFHKMGGRGHTSTALNFGEREGAVAFLVGQPNAGLGYMFHMMNEARVMVGMMAATLALTGFQYALWYARERTQGRLPSNKNPLSAPVALIDHADVRRMLLAQKAYAEGAFSLCLFASQLVDDARTHPDSEQREWAHDLLDFLTPIVKTFPSEFGPRANDLAIQVLGGAGYTDEHPVEMMYRDNRLNPIHEGTTGIQALDLLGRKLTEKKMRGYITCVGAMEREQIKASKWESLLEMDMALGSALGHLKRATEALVSALNEENTDLALANAPVYLQLFGHVVVGWMWLRQGRAAVEALQGADLDQTEEAFYRGKLQAMNYFGRWELPQTAVWSDLLCSLDATPLEMDPDWF
ncbi:acyl-CoA dehydrogenase domain protein [Luminiphilus syltensis NOR5-1B]|uniref:Acyl-CoA dehydrogenase domain protein n=1 Tax=Luminiphilus syltensis NOR5-1B TaxID=565045 RepID=B8KRI8_9GAMM|nr:acyl-CoA dehydrogenase [Luminiphilus syltensis]EED36758.1 acyl-CoA dehydrogenase domain protein [Luminiphilus syltensis NOR5-1B]